MIFHVFHFADPMWSAGFIRTLKDDDENFQIDPDAKIRGVFLNVGRRMFQWYW